MLIVWRYKGVYQLRPDRRCPETWSWEGDHGRAAHEYERRLRQMIICARCGAAVGNIVDHYEVHGGVPKARVFFCPGGRYENAMESTDFVTPAQRELITRVDELMESEAPIGYNKGATRVGNLRLPVEPTSIRNRPVFPRLVSQRSFNGKAGLSRE